ncbi:alanine racemase [Janibacter sp. YB324]|uniref:alanine racemase n=1 Tax=Janibacter sp. YB324 TaxID=2761047 RepID=UPI0016291CF3|nr:alanine racemase [Janibacter sp. YB324]QNF93554.1 alanine racemase [Janibacter sp. YB324]
MDISTPHPALPSVATPSVLPSDAPTDGLSAWADIDLDAIRGNVARLGELAGDADVMAVIKGDAYGHGLVPVAGAALAGGATYLGIAQLGEALAARAAGITAPILTWLFPPGADLAAAVRADLTLSAGAPWALAEIAAAARATGQTARVHLKVDTGLGRGGAWRDDLAGMLVDAARLEAEGVLDVEGIFSHFAYADAPDHPTVRAQQETFGAILEDAERAGLRPRIRHLANSAATLTNPSARFDMVRPGVSIYGLSPVPDIGGPPHFGLREAMRVVARLINVKDCPAGQGVSYGHQYTTKGDTRLGLVPLGYADGIPRHASAVGPMQVHGRRYTVAGRVCMDQMVLDLGADSPAVAGDEVVLIGREADGEPTAQDWAAAIDTINYEIVTRLGPRVPRRYLGGQ